MFTCFIFSFLYTCRKNNFWNDTYTMMNCLRDANLTWEDFVREQSRIIPNVSHPETLMLYDAPPFPQIDII